jgi:uroporphyrinogen-III synthase
MSVADGPHAPLPRVLVTRPREQSERFATRLSAAGFDPVVVPVTELRPTRNGQGVRDAIRALHGASWLAVTSPTGVSTLAGAGLHPDAWRAAGCPKIAAVGSATAKALEDIGLSVDLVPGDFDGVSLAESLAPHAQGQVVVIAQAANARLALRNALRRAGVEVRWFGIYDSHDRAEAAAELQTELANGLAWTTATSSEIARATVRAAGALASELLSIPVASIGPLTSATLNELGFEQVVEADVHTSAGLIELLQSRSEWQPDFVSDRDTP